jgi:hypothetical protein
MVNRRPTPEREAALKFEIAQRYKRNSANARKKARSRGMAAIRLAELSRWLDDRFGRGVELEPDNQGEMIARIFAHHLAALPDAGRRTAAWMLIYTPWLSVRSRERLIGEARHRPLKYTADKLAWKIRLDDATRTRLNIRTIGAYDFTKDQRQARAKAKRAERDAVRRPRNKPAISEPWVALGISRRTWYRRQMAQPRT